MDLQNFTKINMLKVFAALSDHETELINSNDPQAEDIRNYLKNTPVDFDLLESLGVNTKKLTHIENLYQLFHMSYPDLPKSIIRSYIKEFQKESEAVNTVEEFMNKVATSYPHLESILYDSFEYGVYKTIHDLESKFQDRNFIQSNESVSKYRVFHDLVRAKIIGHVLGELYSKGAPFNKLLGILEMVTERYRPEAIARQLLSCLHSTETKDVKDSMVGNYIDAEKLKESDMFDIVKDLDEYKSLIAKHQGEDFEDKDEELNYSSEDEVASVKPKFKHQPPVDHEIQHGSSGQSSPKKKDVDVYGLTQSADPTDPNGQSKMFENSKVPGGDSIDLGVDIGNESTLVDKSRLQLDDLKDEKTVVEPRKIKHAYQKALKLFK